MSRALAVLRGVLRRAWLLVYRSERVRVLAFGITVFLVLPLLMFAWAGVVTGAEYVLIRVGVPVFIMLLLTAFLVTDLVLRLRRRRRAAQGDLGLEGQVQPLSPMWWVLAAFLWAVVVVFNIVLPALG